MNRTAREEAGIALRHFGRIDYREPPIENEYKKQIGIYFPYFVYFILFCLLFYCLSYIEIFPRSELSGVLYLNGARSGNVSIIFRDSSNNLISSITDKDGNYRVRLRGGRIKVAVMGEDLPSVYKNIESSPLEIFVEGSGEKDIRVDESN